MKNFRLPTKREMLQLVRYVQQIRGWHFDLADYDTRLWIVAVCTSYMCGYRGKLMIAIDTEYGRLYLFAWDAERSMYPLRDTVGFSIKRTRFTDYQVVNGVTKLPIINGYTVDTRLKEFRRMEYDKHCEFIPFDSEQGAEFLDEILYLAEPTSRLFYEIVHA